MRTGEFVARLRVVGLVAVTGLAPWVKAVEVPKLDTADYWRAYAYRHAAGEQFEASLTAEQRQLRDAMNKAAQQIAAAREKLLAACGKDASLDETGPEPVCKVKSTGGPGTPGK